MTKDVIIGLLMMGAGMAICAYLLAVHVQRMQLFSGRQCSAKVMYKMNVVKKVLFFPVNRTRLDVRFVTEGQATIETPLTYVDEDVAAKLNENDVIDVYYDERCPADRVVASGYRGNSDARAALSIIMVAVFLLGVAFSTMGITETLEFIREAVRHRPMFM